MHIFFNTTLSFALKTYYVCNCRNRKQNKALSRSSNSHTILSSSLWVFQSQQPFLHLCLWVTGSDARWEIVFPATASYHGGITLSYTCPIRHLGNKRTSELRLASDYRKLYTIYVSTMIYTVMEKLLLVIKKW